MSLKHIKKFQNHNELEITMENTFNKDFNKAVCKCVDEGHTHYSINATDPNDCIQFIAIGGSSSIGYQKKGGINPNMSYSRDKQTWNTWTGTAITIQDGESLYVKGNNPTGLNTSTSKYFYFTISNNVNCKGNIMALLGENITTIPCDYCFYRLFYNCTKLLNAPKIPATALTGYCYDHMFYGCTSLTTAPELPATTLARYCYLLMFYGCTSLTNAPELPATTLAIGCYEEMFHDCTSLTTAPSILPATTLADSCYYYMFFGCNSLTTAPELPAITLTSNCYYCMFYSCNKLNYVKAMFTTEPSSNYTFVWLNNVASTGTFIANPNATWIDTIKRGGSTVPEGWIIERASS